MGVALSGCAGRQQPMVAVGEPTSEAETVRFTVIGDYGGLFGAGGSANHNELAVARMVNQQLCPDFVITVGDNNYNRLDEVTYRRSVGDFYADYGPEPAGELLAPRKCRQDPSGLAFFPSPGNCDLTPCQQEPGNDTAAYARYFWWANNSRGEHPCARVEAELRRTYPDFRCPSEPQDLLFYDVSRGPVRFFSLDSNCADGRDGCYSADVSSGFATCGNEVFADPNTPDCQRSYCTQMVWMEHVARLSPEPWKIAYFHNSPYSSGNHESCTGMQFNYQALGISAVLTGHSHSYNRVVMATGEPRQPSYVYLVNGLSGGDASTDSCANPIDDRRLQASYLYEKRHGALVGTASADRLELSFFSVADPAAPLDRIVWKRLGDSLLTSFCGAGDVCRPREFCDCTGSSGGTCPVMPAAVREHQRVGE